MNNYVTCIAFSEVLVLLSAKSWLKCTLLLNLKSIVRVILCQGLYCCNTVCSQALYTTAILCRRCVCISCFFGMIPLLDLIYLHAWLCTWMLNEEFYEKDKGRKLVHMQYMSGDRYLENNGEKWNYCLKFCRPKYSNKDRKQTQLYEAPCLNG